MVSNGPVAMLKDEHMAEVPLSDRARYVVYEFDTDEGSSGSPVFLNGNLVALHHAADGNVNRGVLIEKILEELRSDRHAQSPPDEPPDEPQDEPNDPESKVSSSSSLPVSRRDQFNVPTFDNSGQQCMGVVLIS